MKYVESVKTRGQESIHNLVDLGKEQPEEVQTWGVTAVAAFAGALALAAAAKGVLGVVGTLAYPPVALTVGALSGGLLGWSFMQRRAHSEANDSQETVVEERVAPVESIDIQETVLEDEASPVVASSDAPSESTVEGS